MKLVGLLLQIIFSVALMFVGVAMPIAFVTAVVVITLMAMGVV